MDMDSVPAEYGPNQTKLNEKSSETKLWYSIMISSIHESLSFGGKISCTGIFNVFIINLMRIWYTMNIFIALGNEWSISIGGSGDFLFCHGENRKCVSINLSNK